MANIHDWHETDEELGKPGQAPVRVGIEPLWRTDLDGALSLRFVDARGKILSISLTRKETDRLAEFLWRRK